MQRRDWTKSPKTGQFISTGASQLRKYTVAQLSAEAGIPAPKGIPYHKQKTALVKAVLAKRQTGQPLNPIPPAASKVSTPKVSQPKPAPTPTAQPSGSTLSKQPRLSSMTVSQLTALNGGQNPYKGQPYYKQKSQLTQAVKAKQKQQVAQGQNPPTVLSTSAPSINNNNISSNIGGSNNIKGGSASRQVTSNALPDFDVGSSPGDQAALAALKDFDKLGYKSFSNMTPDKVEEAFSAAQARRVTNRDTQGRDVLMEELFDRNGYQGGPKSVTADELGTLLKDTDNMVAVRTLNSNRDGVSGKDIAMGFQSGTSKYVGVGVYGNGHYVACGVSMHAAKAGTVGSRPGSMKATEHRPVSHIVSSAYTDSSVYGSHSVVSVIAKSARFSTDYAADATYRQRAAAWSTAKTKLTKARYDSSTSPKMKMHIDKYTSSNEYKNMSYIFENGRWDIAAIADGFQGIFCAGSGSSGYAVVYDKRVLSSLNEIVQSGSQSSLLNMLNL